MSNVYRHALAVALCAALPCFGDEWLNARHDPQRSGRSSGNTRLGAPTVRWRHYLGGSVRGDQILVRDVDSDTITDVVYVAGGKAVAKHADDTILWESELLDLRSFVGLVDLDRDGRSDILALGAHGGVFVLAGQSGRVLWELPRALRGEVSAARVGDLDGDGRDDLYVGQCLFNPVAAVSYSFAEGYASPRELWRLPTFSDNTCGTSADALGDFDGDGQNEVLLMANAVLRVLDGRTGRLEASIVAPPSGQFTVSSMVFVRDVDRDPAQELVIVTNGYTSTVPPSGARRVAVYDFTPTPVPGYTLTWEFAAQDPARTIVTLEADGVRDLDGDGSIDIAFSVLDPETRRWALQVRRASTGELEAMSEDRELTGVASIGTLSRPALFAQDDMGVLHAMSFDGRSLSERFALRGMSTVRRTDPMLAPREPVATRTLTAQLDEDPSRELVLIPFDPSLAPEARVANSVAGFDVDGATPRSLGTFSAEAGATVLVTDTGVNLSRPFEQPVVVSSDGYLQALDRSLASTNRVVTAEFTIPGMHVGGYFSGLGPTVHTPVIGALDAPAVPAVVVRTSKPSLVRLEARGASLSRPPRVLWERPRAAFPLMVDADGDGAREVVAIEGRDIVALDGADAQRARWRAMDAGGPRGSVIVGDVLPIYTAGTPGADLGFSRFDAGSVFHPISLRGADGSARWSAFTRSVHSGYVSFAVADMNSDGTDDFITAANAPLVLDGATGEASRVYPEGFPYGVPIVADFLGRGEREVYLHSSASPDILLGNEGLGALSLLGQWPEHRSYPAGALCRCEGTQGLVLGTLSTPEIWSIRPSALSPTGPPPGDFIRAHRAVAGGRVYLTVDSIPPNVRQGTLSNLTTVADLDGAGHQGLLVGSTDGWLYALDPCSLALHWAMDFRYPVGEAVVGDADGDGTDDVLVSAADGYLYALGPRAYAPSASVHEVDPQSTDPRADVDTIETFNTLSARWDSVPGATSYQVVVRSAQGTSLLLPDFTRVSGTEITLTDLPLRLGATYHFGVIATGPSGSSAEAGSDGVTVVDQTPPSFVLSALPPRFAPRARELSSIMVTFNDRTGLSRTRAEIRRDDGTLVRLVDEHTAPRPQYSRAVRFTWDGAGEQRMPLPEGLYDLVVTATDVAGRSSTESLSLELIAPPPDAGLLPRSFESPEVGCGCHTHSSKHRQGGCLILLLGFVALRPRARRGRPCAARECRVQ